MADNNVADTTEDGQRKQVLSDNGIIIPCIMGSSKDLWDVYTGNSSKGVSRKRKRGRSATTISYKKALREEALL